MDEPKSDEPMLLEVRLTASYPDKKSYAGKKEVLRKLSLDLRRGEILGLVGQSGCGKSTLALAILRLLDRKRGHAEGTIRFQGRDLMPLNEGQMRALRGKEMALVLQSPLAALNPALRLGDQLAEAWKIHRPSTKEETNRALRRRWPQSACLPTAPFCVAIRRS